MLNSFVMDSRLAKAATLGDVAALRALLEEDPLILEKVSLSPYAETPLHIACLSGKSIEFVKEMIALKPSFAMEVNRDGFTPLHIASATGNVEIVRAIMNLNRPDLCLVKDSSYGRIPLHFAVIKGKVDVIIELLSCCPKSVNEVTELGESVFHLAVKNHQLEVLQVLLGKVDGGELLVDAKDKHGHTALDLAVATQQFLVIDLLRNQSKLDMKDITEIIPSETQYLDNMQTNKGIAEPESNQTQQHKTQNDSNSDPKSIWEEAQEMVLVVASLIATVTYQAGLSPPQTIWKEDMKWDTSNCIFHHQDQSSCPKVTYFLFMSFNTAGFFASVFLIFFFRNPSYVQVLLPIALISMMITYVTLSVNMTPNGLSLLIIYLITLAIFIYCVFAVEVVKDVVRSFYSSAAGKVKELVKKRLQRHPSPAANASTSKLEA